MKITPTLTPRRGGNRLFPTEESKSVSFSLTGKVGMGVVLEFSVISVFSVAK
jgi:hypothetical protein